MVTYSVAGGRLLADGEAVRGVPSPNVGGACRPRFLVHHFTGGGEAGAIETLTTPGGVSAHLVVGEMGTVTQLVDFNRVAWHAGRSSWRDVTGSLNPVSIGIEIVNYGDAIEGRPGAYTVYGRRVPDSRVMVARHANGGAARPWQTYTDVQIETVVAISRALHTAYHFEDVVGHDQIAPERKVDPGPAWPMAMVRGFILGEVPPAGAPPIPDSAVPDRSKMQVQRAMNRLGYGPLEVDGILGERSRAAIRAFQASHGLAPDGRVGPATWAEIDAAYSREV